MITLPILEKTKFRIERGVVLQDGDRLLILINQFHEGKFTCVAFIEGLQTPDVVELSEDELSAMEYVTTTRRLNIEISYS